jgi:hypothetical protein
MRSLLKVILNIIWIVSLIALILLLLVSIMCELFHWPFFVKIMNSINVTWNLKKFYVIAIIDLIIVAITSILRDKYFS